MSVFDPNVFDADVFDTGDDVSFVPPLFIEVEIVPIPLTTDAIDARLTAEVEDAGLWADVITRGVKPFVPLSVPEFSVLSDPGEPSPDELDFEAIDASLSADIEELTITSDPC